MDNDNLLIICRSCGRKTLMHNMRPSADGENMICIECAKKGISLKSEVSLSKAASELKSKSNKESKSKSEKMVKYLCTNCKYKFSRKESQQVEKCPYCGKNTIVHDDQLSVDKIIKESQDKKYDW